MTAIRNTTDVAEPADISVSIGDAREDRRRSVLLRGAFDVAVVVVLAVLGFLVRRDGLPTNGLFLDDAWVATGAIYGHVSNLITVGSAHPGFTLGLMGWHDLGGGSLRSLTFPAFIAGIAAAPVLYLALRSFTYDRSICVLLAAIVVISDVHIQQSGRVKSYTIDVLLVLLLAVALPRLARVTWRWPLAVAWVVVAMVLGSVSGTALLASIVAGFILFLHPESDRPVRFAALAAQCIFLGLLYLAEVRATNLDDIENFMKRAYNAHIPFSWNPFTFAGDALDHLGQVARVYPGGSDPWLAIFGLAAVAGLVIASIRSTRRAELVAARFFLLLVAIAFVGAVLGKFPFGTTSGGFLASSSDGGRYTLWMLPAFAFGLAALLQRVFDLAKKQQASLLAFRAVLLLTAIIVVVAGFGDAKPYPQSGSASATAYIESTVRPGDVVIVAGGLVYSFAVSAHLPLTLQPTPEHQIGFTPVFRDSRYHTFGEWSQPYGTPKEIRAAVGDAKRVFVYGTVFGSPATDLVVRTLKDEGFRNESIKSFGEVKRFFALNSVFVWSR